MGGCTGPTTVGGCTGPTTVGGCTGPTTVGSCTGRTTVGSVDLLSLWPLHFSLPSDFFDPGVKQTVAYSDSESEPEDNGNEDIASGNGSIDDPPTTKDNTEQDMESSTRYVCVCVCVYVCVCVCM